MCIVVGTPLELFKIRAQTNTEAMTSYTQLIKDIYHDNGLKGFYKGFWSMFWRDVPCYGLLFFTYDYLCRMSIKPSDDGAVKYLKIAMASGIAGVLNWLPSYPLDVVKTIIQQ